jgi:hypothetical protein
MARSLLAVDNHAVTLEILGILWNMELLRVVTSHYPGLTQLMLLYSLLRLGFQPG